MNIHLLTKRYAYMAKPQKKVKYILSKNNGKDTGVHVDWDLYDRLNNKNPEPEYRGTIEVPANAETVIYESPEGNLYEIPISDLIEADDDHEIEYNSNDDETEDKTNDDENEYESKQYTKFASRRRIKKKSMKYNVMWATTRSALRQR